MYKLVHPFCAQSVKLTAVVLPLADTVHRFFGEYPRRSNHKSNHERFTTLWLGVASDRYVLRACPLCEINGRVSAAAVLVLVAALLSFSSKLSIQSMAFFLSLFCTFLVLVSFIIDLWLFVQVRAVIQATTSMSPALGGGLWLVFASLLLLVLAVFLGLKVRRLGKDI